MNRTARDIAAVAQAFSATLDAAQGITPDERVARNVQAAQRAYVAGHIDIEQLEKRLDYLLPAPRRKRSKGELSSRVTAAYRILRGSKP